MRTRVLIAIATGACGSVAVTTPPPDPLEIVADDRTGQASHDPVDEAPDGPLPVDDDGDGYFADGPERDCDDADPLVHPGRSEAESLACHDGVDNDCDGLADAEDASCPAVRCAAEPACDGTWFEDVTACAGVTVENEALFAPFYNAAGPAWGDVDRDGLPDLYLTSQSGVNRLFRNLGDGTFEPFAFESDVAMPDTFSGGAALGDVDGDGWADLYVLTAYGPNALFLNQAGAGFVRVEGAWGADDMGMGQTATFGDYDGDGDLDLYVTNWSCQDCGATLAAQLTVDVLYRNDGGRFTDVSSQLGGARMLDGRGYAATFFDADGDGDVDLYVANDKGRYLPDEGAPRIFRNLLFRNEGPGCDGWCWSEVGRELGADVRADSMGLAVGDIDNDGDLDLSISHSFPAALLVYGPGDVYWNAGANSELQQDQGGWGMVMSDFDNDGWLDMSWATYLGRDPQEGAELVRNVGGRFVAVDGRGGEPPADCYAVSTADYDRDGWMDLVFGCDGGVFLYRNVQGACAEAHWLEVVLEDGAARPIEAVGARLTVVTDDGLTQVRDVTLGGSLGSTHDLVQHVGLGTADLVSVEVRWPDGAVQPLPGLRRDRLWRVSRTVP